MLQDDVLNKLAIGRFLRELLDSLRSEMSRGEKGKKMLIYSGHDSTLVPLLCALGIFDDAWPPYASYLTLEIGSIGEDGDEADRSNWRVRAIYNDEPRVMAFPGSATNEIWMSLEQFINRLEIMSLTPSQYATACRCAAADEAVLAESNRMREEIDATISGSSGVVGAARS